MTAALAKPLGSRWKDRLGLSLREASALFENADDVRGTPHAGAIRATLTDLGASAVFSVQDAPTVVILIVDDYDREAVLDLHAKLWNQGLTSLLLVLSGDTVRVFSLARYLKANQNDDFEERCLVQTLNATTDALALKDILYGAESGRLWQEQAEYFRPEERIDRILLDNITASHKLLLAEGLDSDAAQALLIQTMFIAYLEDRKIIGAEYFREAANGYACNFSDLLQSGGDKALDRLLSKLREDFNGDLFVAPCSFDTEDPQPRLARSHLDILARFRSGRVEMGRGGGQLRFWGYDFKYIPIELISAVYDRFLGEKEAERRNQGAYYTPMFLADTVISQVWDKLPKETKDKGRFLDPACGSGVFLVRCFQRLCEHWRDTHKSQIIRWASLLAILQRLHGWDLNRGAIRVAVFSLYVALLEEVSPPDIRSLIKQGRLLPKLWDGALTPQDFFAILPTELSVDVVIGNPPWSSRRGQNRPSINWCKAEGLPIPSGEDAWAFAWKSLRHISENGLVAFLLPAMGFLHNHASKTVEARRRFMREARILRIVNFADLRFQLFERAVRPASLILFSRGSRETPSHRFDYWVPKADLNLRIKRLITLGNADKCVITSHMMEEDPAVLKRRIWMNDSEAKLFNYMRGLADIGDLVAEYGDLKRRKEPIKNRWVIGQGFKPANPSREADPAYVRKDSVKVTRVPYLPIESFRPFVQNIYGLRPWKSDAVHRQGFEQGFQGPRILIPSGIDTTRWRLRATYTEEPLTFQHCLQAIVVPTNVRYRAKLLTGLLNSRLFVWFAFHGTSSFGSDRPLVHQSELLRLPFPSPDDLSEIKRSKAAADKIVRLIDEKIELVHRPFALHSGEERYFEKLDRLACDYFCLSEDEIILVSDTVESIIPAVQPRQGSMPDIWKPVEHEDRRAYATTLVRSLQRWFDTDCAIRARLEARSKDLAILRLTLGERSRSMDYGEDNNRSVGESLTDLTGHIGQPLPGNFQLMPDFRIFIENNLYLVKPMQKRFWLKSAALADADAIALDLNDAIGFRESGSRA